MSCLLAITGAGLYIGTLLLAWWLIAAATDAQAFATAASFLSSFIGEVILFCFTWALFHHMLGGIRHFIWDAGYGMDHPEREYLAQATLIGGIVLTVLVWIIAFFLRNYGTLGVFGVIAGAMVAVFIVIGFFGPPVTNRRLEAIAA